MKREIKFRGKRLDTGEWWYGSLVILNGRYFIFNDEGRYEVLGATVGQFTGEFDYHSEEIYEGDLVKYPERADWEEYEWGTPARPRPIIVRTAHPVEFSEGCFWLMPATDGGDDPIPLYELSGSKQPTVIGNIHDNPERLRK